MNREHFRAYLKNRLFSHTPEMGIIAVLNGHATLGFAPTDHRGLVFQLIRHHDGLLNFCGQRWMDRRENPREEMNDRGIGPIQKHERKNINIRNGIRGRRFQIEEGAVLHILFS